MMSQGIKYNDIHFAYDEKKIGNLKSWLMSCEIIKKHYPADEGIWHLQDDIVLSDRFAEVAEHIDGTMIVNGWVSVLFNKARYKLKGERRVADHWNSFPCIFIPNKYMIEFPEWFYTDLVQKKFHERISENKWDDYLFWQYMRQRHRDDKVLNLAPNIVDHVDYIIGGSVLNPKRDKLATSAFWNEPEKLEKLKKDGDNWHKSHSTI